MRTAARPVGIFRERGFVGLAQDASPFSREVMAQDAMPRAALGAAGGKARDQEPDDDTGSVHETAASATFARLHKLLAANLNPEDLASAEELIQQLFSDTAETDNGPAMDRRPPLTYAKRFPYSGRLYRGVYR